MHGPYDGNVTGGSQCAVVLRLTVFRWVPASVRVSSQHAGFQGGQSVRGMLVGGNMCGAGGLYTNFK